MSGAGMLILSPDGLLLRLIADASIWDVIFYRSIFISIALAIYMLFRDKRPLPSIWRSLGKAGWFSTILMAASGLSFVTAIDNTSIANTLILVATMPLFSAVLGWLIIGEAVKPRTWVSIVLALSGIFILFSGSFGDGHWLGDSLAIFTAFLQGLNLVVLRKVRDRNITVPALCISGLMAALVAFPMAQPLAVSVADMGYLMLMGFIIIPVSLVLFLGGARYAPAAEVALLSLVETVLGPFWAWIGVGEVPSTMAIIGGGIVISAVASNAWFGIRGSRTPVQMNA